MKRFFLVLFILGFFSCTEKKTSSDSLTEYIPRKASIIIKTSNLNNFTSTVSNTDFIQSLKEISLYNFFEEHHDYLSLLKPKGETLITYTQLGKEDPEVVIITKYHPSLFTTDSLTTKIDALKTTTPSINRVTTKKADFYTLLLDDIFMVSTSQLLLENTIRESENPLTDTFFERTYSASNSDADASIFIKGEGVYDLWTTLFPRAKDSPLSQTFEWSMADIHLTQNDVQLSGVTLVRDSIGQHLSLLKNTIPQPNKIPIITPLSANGLISITYDDWDVYKNNLASYEKIDPSKFKIEQQAFLSSFNEIGVIYLDTGSVIIGYTIDPDITQESLPEVSPTTTFRQVDIFKYAHDNAFAKAYKPLLSLPKATWYCKLDNFYLFAPEQNALESMIANYQNKATLNESMAFQNTSSQLSSASSVLMVSNLSKKSFAALTSEKQEPKIKTLSFENYPFAALQLIQDRDFMYLNGIINKNEATPDAGAITQTASIKLENNISRPPQLVKNHRTKGVDIVVQDENNTLYLISNRGKVLWQKQLNGSIIGDIQQVDLYRNGRLQLAFVTPKTFYILDRNGNEVSPFPLGFADAITQGLSVFDYENNRKYRFIITQGNKVQMFDKDAKLVKGFIYTEADSEIIFPPRHHRIGNKDYISIAENNGTLNILSRVGKSRITVNETIKFGDTPIYKEGANFTTYDVNGGKISINSNGKLTRVQSDNISNPYVQALGTVYASMHENTLTINNKTISLDFGTYTRPHIFKVGKEYYISVTNTETSQVFCFDNKGIALDNFPVYGITQAYFGYLERNKNLGFVTQGDNRTILIYEVN